MTNLEAIRRIDFEIRRRDSMAQLCESGQGGLLQDAAEHRKIAMALAMAKEALTKA